MMSEFQSYSPWAAPLPDPRGVVPPPDPSVLSGFGAQPPNAFTGPQPGYWPVNPYFGGPYFNQPPFKQPRDRNWLLFVSAILLMVWGVLDTTAIIMLVAMWGLLYSFIGLGELPDPTIVQILLANDMFVTPLIGGLGIGFSDNKARGSLLLGLGVFATIARGVAPFLFFPPAQAVWLLPIAVVPVLYTIGAFQLMRQV